MLESKTPPPQDKAELTYRNEFLADGRRYSVAVKQLRDGNRHLQVRVASVAGDKQQAREFTLPPGHVRYLIALLTEAVPWCDLKSNDWRKQQCREHYPRAYEPWLPQEDEDLATHVAEGLTTHEIAAKHQRQPGAIISRLQKLGLPYLAN